MIDPHSTPLTRFKAPIRQYAPQTYEVAERDEAPPLRITHLSIPVMTTHRASRAMVNGLGRPLSTTVGSTDRALKSKAYRWSEYYQGAFEADLGTFSKVTWTRARWGVGTPHFPPKGGIR